MSTWVWALVVSVATIVIAVGRIRVTKEVPGHGIYIGYPIWHVYLGRYFFPACWPILPKKHGYNATGTCWVWLGWIFRIVEESDQTEESA